MPLPVLGSSAKKYGPHCPGLSPGEHGLVPAGCHWEASRVSEVLPNDPYLTRSRPWPRLVTSLVEVVLLGQPITPSLDDHVSTIPPRSAVE